MNDKRIAKYFPVFGLVAILLLGACAHTVGVVPDAALEPAGFFKGLWHGLILIISFIISLFKEDVAIYAAYNTGGWYDLGFVLGISIMGGGAGRSSK